MVSHGGNGVSYLVDDVDYNYYEYDPDWYDELN